MPAANASGRRPPSRITQDELNALAAAMGGARRIADIYPMTPLQQGLLYQSELAGDRPVYVVTLSCRLMAPLDAALFAAAWQAVVQRHTILRTAFAGLDLPQPVQILMKEAPLPFTQLDWRDRPAADIEAALAALRDDDRAQPFDHARPPLMRVTLVRLGEADYHLLWSFHHLLLDGWSLPLLVGEVFTIYAARQQGEEPALPPSPPFKDYVAWLRRQEPGAAETFWRTRLQGIEQPTLLATDPGRPLPEPRARILRQALGIDLAALEKFARSRRLTLANLVSAAWGLLLARYTRSTDVIFGTVVAGRPADMPGANTRIGLFISTLPLRLAVSPAMRIDDYLAQVQQRQNELLQHETTPPQMAEQVSPLGAGRPLFDTTILFENYPIEAVKSVGMVRLDAVEVVESPHYPLNLQFSVQGDSLHLAIAYDRHGIPDELAARVGHDLSGMLQQIMAGAARIGDLALVTADERARLLGDWLATRQPLPQDTSLHAAFAAQAARTPDARAITSGDVHLTYREVEARANQLAHRLRAMGVGPETIVGLCVSRTFDMVIGPLGILKAGGAYLPLDPAYPVDRLRFMLEDAGAAVLVTDAATSDLLPFPAARTLELGAAAALDRAPDVPPPDRSNAANLCYVIYTSGSTGKPKGVMVEHRSVLNFLHSMSAQPGLGTEDVFAAVTPISFDIAGLEIWGPLLAGARLLLIDRADSQDAAALHRRLTTGGATVMQATPATWRMLAELGQPIGVRVLCGGEALGRDLAGSMAQWGAPAWNLYGPTETTIWSTLHPLAGAAETGSVPIGRPIANTRVYVLGHDLELTPPGIAGELYIAGAGVARGYRGRAANTAERFVPDPFAETPGARMYRTGDLARWTETGALMFLGRIDEQVKIRGFRIELGEIETSLARHPAVSAAVVIARDDAAGDRRLEAYYTPRAGADQPSPAELRDYLRQRLPEHMLPHAISALEAFPLTPSGKIDRRALRAAPGQDARRYLAPRNAQEAALAAIWADVLGLDRVGVEDDFLDLGGDSIKAIRIAARARKAGLAVTLRTLYEHHTVAAVAAAMAPVAGDSAPPPPAADPALPPIDAAELDRMAEAFGGPHRISGVYPASPLQQGLLFHSCLAPESQLYVIAIEARLTGALDVAAFEAAWAAAIRQHDILRTAFVRLEEPTPLQVVLHEAPCAFDHHDLRSLPPHARSERLAALAREIREQPFDFAHPPLMRVRIVQTDDHTHQLIWVMHHVVIDGWSMSVLLNDVAQAYASLSQGAAPAMGPVTAYRDYISHLLAQDPSQQARFWGERLGDLSGKTPLGIERSGVQVDDAAEARAHARMTLKTGLARLEARARDLRITPGTLVAGAWALVLGQYAQERDIVFGVTLSGRPADLPAVEHRVGLFVNTLPLRVAVAPGMDPAQWLLQLHARQLELLEHQLSPLTAVQAAAGLPPHVALFDSAMVFQNYPIDAMEGKYLADGVRISDIAAVSHTHFPLYLEFVPADGQLHLTLSYQQDRFEAALIDRIADHLDRALAALADAATTRLGDVILPSDAERHELLSGHNQTDCAYPDDQCVHDLFVAQARRRPDDLAVACGVARVSFGQLDERSAILAGRLHALGVGPEVVVGVCMERSIDLVAALLGIMRAGGAYLPLDPALPPERIAFMVRDARARVVLVDAAGLASGHGASAWGPDVIVVAAQGDDAAGSQFMPDLQPAGVGPLNTACVIYTSGSSGRPKGVMTGHRSAVNRAFVQRTMDAASDESVFVQKASISFVDAFYEIISPLLLGRPVVIMPTDLVLDVPRFIDALKHARASHLVTVPSLAEAMLRVGTLGQLTDLRSWVLGGEVARPETLAGLMAALPGRRIVNNYASTELSDSGAFHVLAADHTGEAPIGRPVANVRVYVLDDGLRPSAAGVPGALYVAGEGLARGYIHQPGLTADRFVPDPHGPPGSRMYRTGDRARWRLDGTLEFLGRADRQVKIRGIRLELDEIEHALNEHEAVDEAVALARKDGSGGLQLAAWVAAAPTLAPQALRAFLRQRLPSHAVPATIEILPSLPKTASGKLDRQALLARQPAEEAATAEPPQTDTERAVAALFGRVLGRAAAINRADSFFDLGGHSLLATQLIGLARERWSSDLPLRLIFDAPTVSDFARAVKGRLADARPLPASGLAALPRTGDIPLSFAQQQFYLLDELAQQRGAFNVPAAIALSGAVDLDALAASLSEIVRRHEILRTRLVRSGEQLVQIIDPPRPLHPPLIDLGSSHDPGSRASAFADLLRQAVEHPFDLAAEPPLRVIVVKLADDDHRVLLTFHHSATDEWSLSVMAREFSALYAAYRQPDAPAHPLGDLQLQYADYAMWQRSDAAAALLPERVRRWTEHLAGAATVLALPTDGMRPAAGGFNAAALPFTLPPKVADGLNALARSQRVTLFMVLLAGLQIVLSRWSGQSNFLIGTPVAGRQDRRLEALLGCFINTLVLRADLSGDPDIGELLDRALEAALFAYDNQDVPFERLVAEIKPDRDASRHPLFQVMLTLQNVPDTVVNLGDVRVGLEPLPEAKAKFDLLVVVTEAEGGIGGTIQYAAELFEQETIERFGAQLGLVFEQLAAAAPTTRVGDLAVVTAAERQRLLVDWNATAVARPDLCLHDLVAAQCARTPMQTAVISGAEAIDFQTLDRRSNQLARRLQAMGVGPEVVVALYLRRSIDTVIAMLGVLKAGGAYLPLDPTYPPERVFQMLEDSRSPIVLTHEALADDLPAQWLRVLMMDADWPSVAQEPVSAPPCPARPDDLAYVLYTSGSTGQPKGVMMRHAALVNHMLWMAGAFPLAPDDRVLQKTSISFDASVWEVFAPLCEGATLVMAPDGAQADPEILAGAICGTGITRAQFVPASLGALLASEVALGGALRDMFCGGGLLDAGLDSALRSRLGLGIHNLYGPTETCIQSVVHRATTPGPGPSIPIGRPIDNTRVYVLDDQFRLLPTGSIGEICIAGHGLGRGYLGQPGLTAEKFVPDPHGMPGERMYRTGDLGRWRNDGTLEYAGRADAQVKLRGHRIEPSEIETALMTLDGIAQCAVRLWTGEDEPRLVAYVIAGPGTEAPPPATLRAALGRLLPAFMIPQQFVPLVSLPLTPNGKLDAEALPDPPRMAATSAYALPRDEREQTLAAIWADVLGIDKVGIHDNLFELGGDSIKAVQIVANAKRAGLRLSLAAMFQTPTIAELSGRVLDAGFDTVSGADAMAPLLPLQEQGSGPTLFCAPPSLGFSWCYAQFAQALGRRNPVQGLQATAFAGDGGFYASVEAMAADHLRLIRTVQPHGPYHLMGYSFGGLLVHEMARQLEAAGETVALLCIADSDPCPDRRVLSDLELTLDLLAFMGVDAPHLTAREAVDFEAVVALLVHLRKLPDVISADQVPGLVQMIRGINRIASGFTPGVVDCDVLYLAATEEPGGWQDRADRWNAHVGGEIEIVGIRTNHAELFSGQMVTPVARALGTALDRAALAPAEVRS